MFLRNRAFQVKVVKDNVTNQESFDEDKTPAIAITPFFAGEIAKSVIITVGAVYVGTRVATTACRVVEAAAKSYFK